MSCLERVTSFQQSSGNLLYKNESTWIDATVHGKTPKHKKAIRHNGSWKPGSQPNYWAPRPNRIFSGCCPFRKLPTGWQFFGTTTRFWIRFRSTKNTQINTQRSEEVSTCVSLFIRFCLVPRWHHSNTYSAQANSLLFITAATAGTVWDRTCEWGKVLILYIPSGAGFLPSTVVTLPTTNRTCSPLQDSVLGRWFITPLKFNSSPLKMLLGRRSFPIGKGTFQGLC